MPAGSLKSGSHKMTAPNHFDSKKSTTTHLFHKISFKERLIFCRICEFGCDRAGFEVPRRPGAGEVKDTEAAAGFLTAPTNAAELGSFFEAAAAAPGASAACLAAGPPAEGVADSQGRLGPGPLKPEGDFLMATLAAAAFAKGGDFFERRFLGGGCLPLAEGPAGAIFFGAVVLSSTRLSSFAAARETPACLARPCYCGRGT